jgi:hypothetical protein
MNEIWKPVYGYAGLYEVSNLGRVRSVRSGKMLRGSTTSDGYATVKLSCLGDSKHHRVQRLVCIAFRGPPPFEDAQAAHTDGDRSNNRAGNLRWATRLHNTQDKRRHGTIHVQPPREAMRRGEAHPHAKLTEEGVADMRRRAASGERVALLAREYGVARQHAYLVVGGKQWAKP